MDKEVFKLRNIMILLIVALSTGVLGYFIGKGGVVQQQASLYSTNQVSQSKIISGQNDSRINESPETIETWWPAGNGFCYHKIKTQWGSFWGMGTISGLKCLSITNPIQNNNLEYLIKQGALSVTKTAPTTTTTTLSQ